jgi:CheY-like chemotaxis protein
MIPLSVLVVDDHEPSTSLLARLLRREGHRVRTASTVAANLSAAARTRVDLLVGDIGLPDGDGCDMLRTMRDRGDAPRLAIAVSGYGGERVEAECLRAGYASLLTKPVLFEQLLSTFAPLTAPPPEGNLAGGSRAGRA